MCACVSEFQYVYTHLEGRVQNGQLARIVWNDVEVVDVHEPLAVEQSQLPRLEIRWQLLAQLGVEHAVVRVSHLLEVAHAHCMEMSVSNKYE